MKNLLAFFIFCSISISSFAQLQIGLSSGLGLNYRTIKQMKFDDFSNTIYSAETKYTRMKTSNYHSINFNYRFNKNISIESGIEYLNRGYQIKDLKLKYRFSTDSLDTRTYDVNFRINHQYRSIAIPLMINYHIGTKKLNYFVSMGASFQSIIDYKVRSHSEYTNGDTETKTSTFRVQNKRFNLTPILRLGLQYELNEKINLRLSSDFRHDVFSNTDEGDVYKTYFYDINTSIAVFYKF